MSLSLRKGRQTETSCDMGVEGAVKHNTGNLSDSNNRGKSAD